MSSSSLEMNQCADGLRFAILVSAGSSKSLVRGVHGNALKVAVRSPPEKGKANKEAEAVLAEFFGVGKGSVAVVAGQTSRHKQVVISGIDLRAAQEKLAQL
jgi:hypothetical protein